MRPSLASYAYRICAVGVVVGRERLGVRAARGGAFASPRRGLYIANTTQIYPEDRGTNYSARLGREVAERIAQDVPVASSA